MVAWARCTGRFGDGEILQIGADGGGPYLVRWSDSGNESLFFPGPDAHVEYVQRESGDASGQQSSAASRTQPTKRWTVDIYLYEDEFDVGQRCPAQ